MAEVGTLMCVLAMSVLVAYGLMTRRIMSWPWWVINGTGSVFLMAEAESLAALCLFVPGSIASWFMVGVKLAEATMREKNQ